MNVEQIKGNVTSVKNSTKIANRAQNRTYFNAPHDVTSFTSAPVNTGKLSDFLLSIMPKKITRMVNIHKGMGEVQNQLINAIGTGLVAPIFIKYNPISDTDKDTRTYTAWRQPVSAVLAVCTQAAIVLPFNKLIKWMADSGYLGQSYNSSLFPSKDYVKKLVLRDIPEAKNYSKKEMEDAISRYNKDFSSRLKQMIEQDRIVFNTTDGRTLSTSEMPKKEFQELFSDTINNLIKNEENEVNKAINKKLPKKLARANFFRNHAQESREVLTKVNGTLNEILSQATSTADTIEGSHNKINKDLKNIIKELKKDKNNKEVNKELIKIIREIKDRNINSSVENVKIMQEKVAKMLNSISTIEGMATTNDIHNYVSEVIKRRATAINDTIAPLKEIQSRIKEGNITVKEAQEIIDQAIEKSSSEIRQKLLNQGVAEEDIPRHIEMIESAATRLKSKAKSISSNIAETLKKRAKSNIDGCKRWTGLGVSLAILPLTCWLLNKIYPWFMDKAFPELSNKAASAKEKKKQEMGGNK